MEENGHRSCLGYYVVEHITFLDLFFNNFGSISLDGCMDDCSYAWVYKDAQNFGLERYKALLGNNVYCRNEGPILEGGSSELYAHFDECPSETPKK